MANEQLFFRYHFAFKEGDPIVIEIKLDPKTLEFIVPGQGQVIPEWCKLDYQSCDACEITDSDYCPVAANIAVIVEAFKVVPSIEIVDVIVETNDRTYYKEQISIQKALGSLFGIIMVTSGCKSLDKLRPMVRFHLPFATMEETIYRSVAMFLVAQYFRSNHGLDATFDLRELEQIYNKVDEANVNLVKRLQLATEKDATLNAVVVLDTFAQMIPLMIEDTLEDLKYIFHPFLS